MNKIYWLKEAQFKVEKTGDKTIYIFSKTNLSYLAKGKWRWSRNVNDW